MEESKVQKNKCANKNRVTTLLDDNDYNKVQAICKRTGMSQSSVLRIFFKSYFQAFEKQVEDGRIF